MNKETYKKHYEKYMPIYKEISEIDGAYTVWIPTHDHNDWYVNDRIDDSSKEAWDRGYPNKSEPRVIPYYLNTDIERSVYTTITYAPKEAYKTAYYKEVGDDIEWMDNNNDRLPDYGDMSAWGLFVDIDIKDKYKERPINNKHKKVIENRLQLWVKVFKQIAGDSESVQLLDSGGGVYAFIPPSALSPVADRYDKEDLNLIFNEIGKRMREVTDKVNELICDQDDYPNEIFSADKVQNKNRQFKTIGSIHKSINAVVYPIDTNNIQIEHKKVSDITDSDIEEAFEWVENFTHKKHRERVESIIEYLFQGKFTKREDISAEYIEGENWEHILDKWVENKKESIKKWEISRSIREDIDEDDLTKKFTTEKDVIYESVKRINNKKLQKYIVEFLGPEKVYHKSGSEEMDFFPFWRADTTSSGRSAFYDYYQGNSVFTDKADGTSRGIIYWVALEMTYDDKNYPNVDIISNPSEDISKRDYWRVVDELRNRGEDIPILINYSDDDEKYISDKSLIRAGSKLNLIDIENDVYGDLSSNFPYIKSNERNMLLDKLTEYDIEHEMNKYTELTKESITDIKNIINSKTEVKYLDFVDNMDDYNKITNLDENIVLTFYTTDSIFENIDTVNYDAPKEPILGIAINQTKDYVIFSRIFIKAISNYDDYNSIQDLKPVYLYGFYPLWVPKENLVILDRIN